MNILITGANGQLGSEINDIKDNYKAHNLIFKGSSALDICNYNQLESFLVENNIEAVINCAAYTAVDKAEKEQGIAKEVNAIGVLNIVNALKKTEGKCIHISTDYVFDGNSFLPYQEEDEINPIGVYGNTKREGELAILDNDIDAIVIRTSWLYSSCGNNFVKTMMRLGNEREELGVIFDQVGTPTYAKDLAKTCLEILTNKEKEKISRNGKLYHFSNEGVASWFDFATAIMDISNTNCNVKPIETKDYPTLAKRPHFSVLNKSKIKKDFGIEIPYWREALKQCISKLNHK
ncbi:dTDP-4-dehydrorhamnose reductase [Polaribacter dokdonensis]|uniref:dTDP-4-dehydrorhamnose reductase n=1 Tax=Polaribacter dokdonensis DSW-5 TaxID=1300348 RepID=A0A0M9CE74_9FLAO|nr:dTDP-4-dehydrorhamnose reductase [Polaribacter dokdonensis]KOY50653.1 dTDP-4-dehydrorhamnose reductase [Polaribacter dokdonensis DSW-5]SEE62274.1 dTDP-4-dehydrorhamnose reductase [Polaribacter dokdonensis DSW-5]